MSTFTTPNGKAQMIVQDHQDQEMIDRGMVLKKSSKATNDVKASKKLKNSADKKPISEVKNGDTRTN